MFPTLEATWTGDAGEFYTKGVCYLDGYVYAPLWEDPGRLIKIDAATMTKVDEWIGTANQVAARCVETDGAFLYVGCSSAGGMWENPSRVVKINPATMTTVDEWVGEDPPPVWPDQGNPERITYDGTYIYVTIGFNMPSRAARLVKIDPATMATVGQWDGVGAQYTSFGHTMFDDYAYVSCGSVPARVAKVDKTTMTTVGEWVGDISDGGWIEGLVFDVTNDGTYVYAGTYDYLESLVDPTRLIKIDPATMTTVSKYQGAADELFCMSTFHYNGQVFMGLLYYPHSMILRIDTATMTKVDRWEDVATEYTGAGFALGNPKFLYAGLWGGIGGQLAKVIKFELPGLPSKGGSSALLLFAKMLMG